MRGRGDGGLDLGADEGIERLLVRKPSRQFRIALRLLQRRAEFRIVRVLPAGAIRLQDQFGFCVVHNLEGLYPRACSAPYQVATASS